MKELTTEQKAKAYDEALENMRKFRDALKNHEETDLWVPKKEMVTDIEYYFPELKESEDEMIKRILHSISSKMSFHLRDIFTEEEFQCFDAWSNSWLEKQGEPIDINPSEFDLRLNKLLKQFETLPKEELAGSLSFYLNIVQNDGTQGDNNNQNWEPSKEQINAFEHFVRSITESGYASPYDDNTKLLKSLLIDLCKLEKRGEQKSVDKVEPKFHEGEWIINAESGYIRQILKINNGCYETDCGVLPIKDYESVFCLWTIKNAKEGEVLALSHASKNYIIIYRGLYEKSFKTIMSVFCFYDVEEDTYYDETDSFHIMNTGEVIKPATKEQRDLLFQKMREAGFEWDADKKELKKIEEPENYK